MSPAPSYGRLERALHRVAFASRRAQLGLADLARWWYRRELAAFSPGPPVLVAALPRAGTTILLHELARFPELATLEAGDVPFELCPMPWRAWSKRLRRPRSSRERAHGDGILVSPDSPEALEEPLWMAFWPEHYRERAIEPWTDCSRAEFVQYFEQHRREVIALRRRNEPRAFRYLAKNNADVARIPGLFRVLPDVRIVVPFREPVQHAASLLRQHLRFCELHAQDPFARRYMAATGHFEFGADLRPIDFDGWLAGRRGDEANSLPFWLDYWVATYRQLRKHAHDERILLVDFARLAATRDLAPLAERLSLREAASPLREGPGLRPLRSQPVEASTLDTHRLAEARALHQELVDLAVRAP